MPARTSPAVLVAPKPEPILCCAVVMPETLRIGVLSKSSGRREPERAPWTRGGRRNEEDPDRTGESRSGPFKSGHGWRSPLGERLHRASAERSSLWANGEARGHCPIRTHVSFNGQPLVGVPLPAAFEGEVRHRTPKGLS